MVKWYKGDMRPRRYVDVEVLRCRGRLLIFSVVGKAAGPRKEPYNQNLANYYASRLLGMIT